MSCCGQQRQALRSTMPNPVPTPAFPSPALRDPTPLVYLGDLSIVVRGSGTGLVYVFRPGDIPLGVDDRDASQLIATGQFARAAAESSLQRHQH